MSSIPWLSPERARTAARGLNPFGRLIRHSQRALAERAGRWAKRRQGSDGSRATLAAGRVYILPTGVGLVFALMLFAMLLGSMNYNNNLSFALTFLLTALGFVSMHVCQRTLVGLDVKFAGVDPVHAGQGANFRIAVTNRAQKRRFQVELYSAHGGSEAVNLKPGESHVFELEVPTERRGYLALPRFGVRSLFPFELFRAWSWLHMDSCGIVYPQSAEDAGEPPFARDSRGHRQHDARGEEDFAGLRRFHPGDSPRHVAWKAYARSGELLAKRFSGADQSSQWFDFDSIDGADIESRLSILTCWILEADRQNGDYGLKLPGKSFPPSHGAVHRHRCLEALALYDLPQTADDAEA